MFFVPSYSSIYNLELVVNLSAFFCVHVSCYSVEDFERFLTTLVEANKWMHVAGCRYIQYDSPLNHLRSAVISHYHEVWIWDHSVTVYGFVVGFFFIIRVVVIPVVALIALIHV